MADAFVERVARAIAAQHLLPAQAHVVIGVSGGADSVALLSALAVLRRRLKLTLRVAHLDHALRDASSHDAAFVRELSGRLGVPVTVSRQDVATACATHKWSLEDGARRLRHAFLQEVATAHGADYVALAHTADDQAETVLLRLLRGTGLLGLGAIAAKRAMGHAGPARGTGAGPWIVRPLLGIWRHEIVAYLKREGLPHREDATNQDTRFVRNRIRHELLPLLEARYNPNIKAALTQLAEQSSSDYDYLQDAAGKQWRRTAKAKALSGVVIRLSAFLRQPKAVQRQLVRRAIQDVSGDAAQVEFRHWLEAEQLFRHRPAGSLVHLPGGVRLRREAGQVICERVAGLADDGATDA